MPNESHESAFSVTERSSEKSTRYDFTEDVTRARAGDEEAFESLYWKSIPFLETEVRKFFQKPEDAEDALQEVYIKIYEKLGQLEEPKAFLGWALSICKRTCINRLKTLGVHTGKDDLRPTTSEETDGAFLEGLDVLPADEYRKDYNPNVHVEASHVSDVVREVLESLPENQQMCLLLWMESYSAREISEELDMPLGTVKSNIKYGKEKVKKVLEQMHREGTFDYKMLHSDPISAFLYLAEQYFSQPKAVPSMGDSLLASLKPVLGTVAGTTSVAVASSSAATAGKLTKFLKDPATSIVSVVLVVAIAIGISIGMQTLSAKVPTMDRDDPNTVQTSKRTSTEETAEELTDGLSSEEAPGENAVPGQPNDVDGQPVASSPQGPNDSSRSDVSGSQRTSVETALNNGRLTATALTELSAGNVAGGQIGQVLGNAVSVLGRNTPGGRNSVTLTVSEPAISNRGFSVDGLVSNYLTSPVSITAIDDLIIKNMDGKVLAKASFDMDQALKVASGEYAYIALTFPKGYYNEALASAVVDGNASHNPNITAHLNYTKQSSEDTSSVTGHGYKIAGTPEPSTSNLASDIELYNTSLSKKNSKVYVDVAVQNLTGKKVKLLRIEDLHVNSGWVSEIIGGDVILDSPIILAKEVTCRLRIEFPESAAKRDSISDALLYIKYNAIYEYVE